MAGAEAITEVFQQKGLTDEKKMGDQKQQTIIYNTCIFTYLWAKQLITVFKVQLEFAFKRHLLRSLPFV